MQELGTQNNEKRYYIKRKLIKDEALIYNGSIFPSSDDHSASKVILKDEVMKYQTITTAIQRTVTVRSQQEEHNQRIERIKTGEKSEILPRVYAASESKYSRQSVWEARSKEKEERREKAREKVLNYHISDPLYLRLQQTVKKRANNSFNQYKRGWIDSSLRRKGSVVESSLQKAANTLENINKDSLKRKTCMRFTQSLRNNHQEKVFIFPAKMRQDIQGLKGKGGSVIRSSSRPFLIQEVYKFHRAKSQPRQ